MVTEQTQYRSVLRKAFSPYVGTWEIQSIFYGTTFFIALAAALIADLALGQSETFAAFLSVGVVVVLLFLAPLLSERVHNRATSSNEEYSEMYRNLMALVTQVNQLSEQVEASSRPFEMVLDSEVARDLELLIRTSSAPSTIQYVQDLVFSDSRLRLPSGSQTDAAVTLPASLKTLLEQLAKANGFVSGEKYLAFVLETRARRVREAEEKEMREVEERKRGNENPSGKAYLIEQDFLDPSRSAERWRVEVESRSKLIN